MNDDTKPDAPQSDPAERFGILAGWNLPAVCFALAAFYCIVGAAVAAFLGNLHAAAWAVVAGGLAAGLMNEKRWK